jgi:CelD/BcsL family acetyltransferase involved in cellulose biosynthesis
MHGWWQIGTRRASCAGRETPLSAFREEKGSHLGALKIIEARRSQDLAALQESWLALQARCPQITPYQTWEWNAAWWRHLGARKRLCLLLFYANRPETLVNGLPPRSAPFPSEGLVGIAPLYVSWHLGLPLRRLAWLGTGLSDYLGPIALPEWEPTVAAALLDYAQHRLRGWDMADLQQLPPDSPVLAVARESGLESFGAADVQPGSTRFQRNTRLSEHPHTPTPCVLPMEPCPYLRLPSAWEDLTARLGKKMRSNLSYYDRLLRKTFPDTEYALADTETLEAGMTALFALHQSRWNARWLPGVLGGRRVQAFHREVAARFLERGWLRLHLLRVDGAYRAALYCFAFGGRALYYLGGFAPELSKYSLGTLLTAQAIRQAVAEGQTEFDFLRGNESYKYRWQPEERRNSRLLLLRSRGGMGSLGELPGRAGLALNRVERYIEHRAKVFAEQQGRASKKTEG